MIEKGARLRVGRTDFADFVVPYDGQMSGEHFELRWDGERCTLRDLASVQGTRLAGEPVEEAEVEHGAWIRAGATDFLVHVEGKLPPPEEEEADEGEEEIAEETRALRAAERAARQEAAERALVALRAEAAKEKLYAVLDAARDDRILQLLHQNIEEHRSLYDGVEGETMADVAPYLAGPMKEDSRLLEALVLEGWGKRWGIYCTSESVLKEVRRHFRRFLMVEEEETGERLYFRFYDPAVLGAFLPTCSRHQHREFCGEIDSLWAEGDSAVLVRVDSMGARASTC